MKKNNLIKNVFPKLKTGKRRAVAVASLAVLFSAGGWTTYDQTKKTVAVELDGKKQTVETHGDTVGEVLSELKIDVKERDILSPKRSAKVKEGMEIVWDTARKVELTVGEEKQTLWTTADTVEEMITKRKISLGEHDQTKPHLDKPIQANMDIEILRAFPVTLTDGEKESKTWSTSTTVADFLKQQEITVGKLDRVTPHVNKKLAANDSINIVRVEKVTDVVEEPKNFEVVTKNDESLLKGQEKTIQAGKTGSISRTYEITRENGKEVSRTIVAEKILQESQDKIVAVGTKEPPDEFASAGAGREFYVTSTAYTAHCNGCSGITATGINLLANPGAKVIAVDPRVIPLGSRVYVEGYGYAIAGDTGGAIKGNKIDVFIPSHSQAQNWGRKRVKIKVLN